MFVGASLLGAPLFSAFILRDVSGALAVDLRLALAFIGGALIALMPAAYLTRELEGRPHALARWSDTVEHFWSLVPPALLVCEGIVLALAAVTVTFAGAGAALADWALMAIIVLFASALVLCGAIALVVGWIGTRPGVVRSDGVVITPERMPQLHARVQRVAMRLAGAAPARIILGLEPRAYVSVGASVVRAGGLLPAAYTLCLPAIALRALTDVELDALIGHELGHYRAPDGGPPACRVPAVPGVQHRHSDLSERLSGLRSVAEAVATRGMAPLLLYVHAASRRREELAADRAAAQVADAATVIAVLLKLAVLKMPWGRLLAQYRRRAREGGSCRNLVADHMLVTQRVAVGLDARSMCYTQLVRRAGPLDTHPTTSQRAAALGVSLEAVIPRVLAELERPRETVGLEALEEELTALEMRLARGEPDGRSAGAPLQDEGGPHTLH